jgi:hypothetical protein
MQLLLALAVLPVQAQEVDLERKAALLLLH